MNSFNETYSEEFLKIKYEDIDTRFTKYLKNSQWMIEFPGREILKRFSSSFKNPSLNYEIFRNLIISKMKNQSYKPEGMKKIIDKII